MGKHRERRLRHRLPCPACDTPSARARIVLAGLDERTKIGFVVDPVPDKAQSCQEPAGTHPASFAPNRVAATTANEMTAERPAVVYTPVWAVSRPELTAAVKVS